ncbi:PREDICTED: protein PXR1-like [Vollenhovia emeryi]|uniref:protein PXR1-like n=1 Tax=Vollenhovia emeryi TaxID=411798 RepID=UPI0005F4AAC6|nr:PREDICTED: protein PXR1-like [Vollenhovia emeryi]
MEMERCSRDKIIGNGGKNFVNAIQERGWYMLNGKTEGDWEGEFTYVGARGSSVIDYVIVNELIKQKIVKFSIGERVDSDHMPLVVEMKEPGGKEEEEEDEAEEAEEEEQDRERKIILWDGDAKLKYTENIEKMAKTEIVEDATVDEQWKWGKEIVDKAMVYKVVGKRKKRKIGYKDWWDRSCTRKKRELKRWYRKWRTGRCTREEVTKRRRELIVREWLGDKKRERREKEEDELRELKSEKDIWKFINMRREKRKWTENNIHAGTWREYFKELLGAEEETKNEEKRIDRTEEAKKNRRRGEGYEETEEMELKDDEIIEAANKMRLGKAVGTEYLQRLGVLEDNQSAGF